jgi:hypothetical protein
MAYASPAQGQSGIFHFILIKPSHYDDDGYVIQWLLSVMPSNTLAALYGLAADAVARKVLGDDVELRLSAYDETNTRINPRKIVRQIRDGGGRGLVGLIGVQSNQFPRAMDIARPLRAAGIQVCIGGFHVSGCLAMLPELPPDIREAQELGIALFAGEAEGGRLDRLLRDAYDGALRPLYNYINDLPNLEGAVTPFLPRDRLRRTAGPWARRACTSFDAGRGCPFQCSFCTIINVQGRKSRYRDADDVERIIRGNLAQGVPNFFITDDNFARNRQWEAIFDRLIKLREVDGLRVQFIIQVDTLCHNIPNFIEKAGRAGVCQAFIGLENINPESLMGAKKRQNRITEYRRMLQAWRKAGVITLAGYILGFPNDTTRSILRDIEIIQRELPLDFLEFFILTPLPGSEDHRKLWLQGAWLDPDMNKYDANHVAAEHPLMSREELQEAWWRAWRTYYSPAHMVTMLRRAAASGIPLTDIVFDLLWFRISFACSRIHPLEAGYFRLKFRRDRRPGMPKERPLGFYLGYARELLATHLRMVGLIGRLALVCLRIKLDPSHRAYSDLSLTPVTEEELDELDLFMATGGARAAVARKRGEEARRAAASSYVPG